MASPSSSRNTRLSNRGPLLELPLDHFVAPLIVSKLGSNTKRPISPGTPALYSPAKRRILSEEGHFGVKSPLSGSVSTASSSGKSVKTPQYHQHITVSRFTTALTGPDSPARKLDFGTPKGVAVGSRAPLHVMATSSKETEYLSRQLALSPQIQSGSRSRQRNLELEEFSTPSSSRTHSQLSQTQSLPSPSWSTSSQPHHHFKLTCIPRELPPPVDPQSIHYPGFSVYQDPHIFIPTFRNSSSPVPTSPSVLTPLENHIDGDSDIDQESNDEIEMVKENLPPRKKLRKVATVPVSEKTQLFSPPGVKSFSLPASPPQDPSPKDCDMLRPRHMPIFGISEGTGSRKSSQPSSKEERKARRRALEEEVDGEPCND